MPRARVPLPDPPNMSLTTAATLRVVLYEGAGSQPLDGADRFAAITALLEKSFAVTRATAEHVGAPRETGPILVLGKFEEGKQPAPEALGLGTTVRVQDISGF